MSTAEAALRPDLDDLSQATAIAAAVPDPELPFVTLAELGILREVSLAGQHVVVTITPTYSGCPAMREIALDIVRQLAAAGFADATVRTVLAPAWTTDWITAEGRRKLIEAGIAPPASPAPTRTTGPVPLTLAAPTRRVDCPRCRSRQTTLRSQFSGTACKALYWCESCAEPFEYVKEI